MAAAPPWYQTVSIPTLLRAARSVYGNAMRKALDGAGYDDIPANGLFIIGGLALEAEVPLGRLIEQLGMSKQAAGQLVDTLVTRGYLARQVDPDDRRRLMVKLTDRGRDAARVQTGARERIDAGLAARVGDRGIAALRTVLAALIERKEDGTGPAPRPGIATAVPILFVRDVTRAAAYYRDRLGFRVDFLHGEPPFYGAVARDGARLHLRVVHAPNFADLAAREESLILATVEVADVRAIHAEFERRGADIVQAVEEQVWGGTDIQVRDPDGNVISFVEYSASSAAD